METAQRTGAEPLPGMVGITSRSDPKAVLDKSFIAQVSACGPQGHLPGQRLSHGFFPSPWPGPRTPPNAPPREFKGQKRERIPQILESNTEKLCNSGFW